jgi:hypothetical protein
MSVKLLEDYFTSGASERLLSDIRGTSSCPIAYTRETACGDDRFLELCGCLARDSSPRTLCRYPPYFNQYLSTPFYRSEVTSSVYDLWKLNESSL